MASKGTIPAAEALRLVDLITPTQGGMASRVLLVMLKEPKRLIRGERSWRRWNQAEEYLLGDIPVQWPDAFAYPTITRTIAATPAAICGAVNRRRPASVRMSSASFTGQTETQVRQPLHSGVRTVRSVSTGMSDGHAAMHFRQSMHERRSRVMRRTREGDQPHQRAIRAQVPAPDVLRDDRQNHEGRAHLDCGGPCRAEEVEHLHVGHQAIRTGEKRAQFARRHARHGPREEREQDVFQTAKRHVRPAWQRQIAAEEIAAPRHNHSDKVPIGHSQLQNALRNTSEMVRNAISRNMPAG